MNISSEDLFSVEGQLTLMSPEDTKTVLANLEELGWPYPGTWHSCNSTERGKTIYEIIHRPVKCKCIYCKGTRVWLPCNMYIAT